MNREQGLQLLAKTPIIAIARGVREQDIVPAAEALLEGGISVMEVTLNTPGALHMIALLQQKFGDRMFIGAGTVTDRCEAEQALQAGASFLVAPNTDPEMIRFAVQAGVPVYPGALTPTEIVTAWKAGATAVKIFPSSGLGLTYLKELKGPFDQIPFVAVGGINETNIGDYLNIGCAAVGVGGSLFKPDEISRGNFAAIAEKARKLAEAAARFAQSRLPES